MKEGPIFFVLGMLMGAGLCFLVVNAAVSYNLSQTHKRAIIKQAAIYSTDSGTFTWTDERVKFIVEGK